MHHRPLLIVSSIALTAAASTAAGGPDVDGRITALAAANPQLVEISRLGVSRAGRPIQMVWLTDRTESSPAPADRPALVIVAGVNGQHLVGVETALGVAERLVADQRELLKTHSVFIVPRLNPDSFAFNADAAQPKMDYTRTVAPYDADHDGRVNEDPAEDLNGDGVITMMRIANPPPGSPLTAQYVADTDNARLLRTPDAAKGEVAKYALLIEGIDNDGDGQFNEDGPGGSAGGGVNLDWNTPYRWKELTDGVGAYQLCEPESLALVEWMLSMDTIVAVVVYGPHDTLVNVPEAGKFDQTGQVPLGIENGDKAVYDDVSKVFKEITRMTGAPAVDSAGSVHGWAYAHFGAYSFSTPVWVRPDLVKAPDPPPEAEAPAPGTAQASVEYSIRTVALNNAAAQPGAGGGGRRGGGRFGGSPSPAAPAPEKKDVSEEAKWLKFSDDSRGGTGFIDWQPFDHPQLGAVEIGGFVPGFRHNPPDEELPRLADEQAKFAAALAGRFPVMGALEHRVERLGQGMWRVSARAVNNGTLPMMSAMGLKARRALPTLLQIDVPVERIVSGSKVERVWAIAGSGGAAEASWVIVAEDGSGVRVRLQPTFGPDQSVEIKLEEGGR